MRLSRDNKGGTRGKGGRFQCTAAGGGKVRTFVCSVQCANVICFSICIKMLYLLFRLCQH